MTSAQGAYLTAKIRRFKGNESYPKYTDDLDFQKKTEQITFEDTEKLYGPWEDLGQSHNIITNAGRDYLHNQAYASGLATTLTFRFVGVSSNAYAPAAGDTTLTSEITTSGFTRQAADSATHSNGTNTSVVVVTFTASGTLSNIQLGALFTAVSSGTMANEATFSLTSVVSGDQLQLTWTITLG
jgi:hypothetical protein